MNKFTEGISPSKIEQIACKYLRAADDNTVRQALEIVITDRNVSIRHLQNKLRIGYNRVLEVIDVLEKRGIIGQERENRREILILNDLNTEISDEMGNK